MAIGFWDNVNARIESAQSHPMLITSYNSGGIKLGINNDNAMGTAANSNQDTTYGAFSVSYSF